MPMRLKETHLDEDEDGLDHSENNKSDGTPVTLTSHRLQVRIREDTDDLGEE